MNTTALSPGTVIAGPKRNYTVLKVLGQGGFGITYLVEGPVQVDNITVEVKFAMKEHFISSLCSREADSRTVAFSQPVAAEVERSLRSFIKEAQRLQELRFEHPNIVKINEVFEANNTAYYVMEHLEGETLHDYVRRVGPLSVQDAEFFLRPIAEAVGQLHRNRLTHYDIKPANIIITKGKDGAPRPVLIDFGLSKHYDREGQATSTLSGGGYSPGYSPIEQYSGIKVFTPQADVYALAATMFYCLTGRTPAESAAMPVRTLAADLASVPGAPIAALTHAIAVGADERTPDANAFVAEVFGGNAGSGGGGGGGGHTVPHRPAPDKINNDGGTKIIPQRPRSKKPLYIGIAAAAAILLGLGIFFMSRGNNTRPEVAADTLAAVTDTIPAVVEIEQPAVAEVVESPVVETPVAEQPAPVATAPHPVQREYGHAEARHQDLATRKGGEYRYFTLNEWNEVPDKGTYTKFGVVITQTYHNGQIHRFILALNDNGQNITWDEAMSRYASQMPNWLEGEAIVADPINIMTTINNFGGSMYGSDERDFWTKTEYDSERACQVHVGTCAACSQALKSYSFRVRSVYPLP